MASTRPKNDTLLQTMVSKDLHQKLRKAAEAEGISVAAWLRRLVMRAFALESRP